MSQWQGLGEVSYRKWAVYDMEWALSSQDLDDALTACAGFGGPMAVVPNKGLGGDLASFEASGFAARKDAGRIYSMCGRQLGTFPLEGKPIARGGLGWLDFANGDGAELLLVVYVSGAVHAVTVCGEAPAMQRAPGRSKRKVDPFEAPGLSPRLFSLSLETSEQDGIVVHACVFGDGVVAVLQSGRVCVVFAAQGVVHVLNEGNPMSEGGLRDKKVTDMAVVLDRSEALRDADRLRTVVVVVATSDARVFAVRHKSCEEVKLGAAATDKGDPARVLKIAASSNGRFVAFFDQKGCLTVMNSTFSKAFLEFDTKAGVPPVQMCWCGLDAVVMQWNQLGLLMVGPYGDWIKYTYTEPVILAQEIDALRILSGSQLEILQRVPPSTEAISRIGSFAPAAILCDAVDAMENRDAKADQGFRAIKEEGTLVEAVKDCIKSARAEFDVARQQQLLRAASVGKTFADRDSDRHECAKEFVLASNALRVLNVVRHASVGLPLTIQQFELMTPARLAVRLGARRHHLLALKICAYLGLPQRTTQSVLTEWATSKLMGELPPLDRQPNEAAQAAGAAGPGDPFTSAALGSAAVQVPVTPTSSEAIPRKTFSSPIPSLRTSTPPSHWARPEATASSTFDQEGKAAMAAAAYQEELELNERERQLFEVLQAKLAPARGIRYARLSQIAQQAGKLHCASLFAHTEPQSVKRTVRLLSLGEKSEALADAVGSNDANLVLFAVLCLWPKATSPLNRQQVGRPLAPPSPAAGMDIEHQIRLKNEFLALVAAHPRARDALIAYCKAAQDGAMLKDLFQFSGSSRYLAKRMIMEAYAAPQRSEDVASPGITTSFSPGGSTSPLRNAVDGTDAADSVALDRRIEHLGVAVELFRRDRNGGSFYAQACNEQLRLLRRQRELESLTGRSCFVGHTLVKTVFNCLLLRLDKKAQDVRTEFMLPDLTFCVIQVQAFAKLRDWERLRELAAQKRLPVSFLVFVEACLEADHLEEARFYALQVKEDKEKLQAFIKTKSWENAVNAAVDAKDVTSLQLIRNNCRDEELKTNILQQVRQLQQG
ncbi:Protein VACUOLELESS1 (Vacuolar protein sorting-associated protein 16 homolog) [Durusdinium trenchii]|uniref:Protein VACUOLELESS1 (Vacuolar protein sorting-associated protein 16 homolog) n=1 Tax=Durusdinium trenchii TaxID=1381693 RepID=A0ABP0IT53_9DINO